MLHVQESVQCTLSDMVSFDHEWSMRGDSGAGMVIYGDIYTYNNVSLIKTLSVV